MKARYETVLVTDIPFKCLYFYIKVVGIKDSPEGDYNFFTRFFPSLSIVAVALSWVQIVSIYLYWRHFITWVFVFLHSLSLFNAQVLQLRWHQHQHMLSSYLLFFFLVSLMKLNFRVHTSVCCCYCCFLTLSGTLKTPKTTTTTTTPTTTITKWINALLWISSPQTISGLRFFAFTSL